VSARRKGALTGPERAELGWRARHYGSCSLDETLDVAQCLDGACDPLDVQGRSNLIAPARVHLSARRWARVERMNAANDRVGFGYGRWLWSRW